MRISDWSSDVCSSDLSGQDHPARQPPRAIAVEGVENRIDKRLETDFPLPPPEHRVADLADEVASHLFHDGRLEPGRATDVVKQIGVGLAEPRRHGFPCYPLQIGRAHV